MRKIHSAYNVPFIGDIISKEGVPLDRAEGTMLEGFIKEGILKDRSKFSKWKGKRGILGEGHLMCLEDAHSVRMEIRLQGGIVRGEPGK